MGYNVILAHVYGVLDNLSHCSAIKSFHRKMFHIKIQLVAKYQKKLLDDYWKIARMSLRTKTPINWGRY